MPKITAFGFPNVEDGEAIVKRISSVLCEKTDLAGDAVVGWIPSIYASAANFDNKMPFIEICSTDQKEVNPLAMVLLSLGYDIELGPSILEFIDSRRCKSLTADAIRKCNVGCVLVDRNCTPWEIDASAPIDDGKSFLLHLKRQTDGHELTMKITDGRPFGAELECSVLVDKGNNLLTEFVNTDTPDCPRIEGMIIFRTAA